MKKILALCLVAIMVLSAFAACTQKPTDGSETPVPGDTTQPVENPTNNPEQPTEAPEPTPEPTPFVRPRPTSVQKMKTSTCSSSANIRT